MNRGIQFDSSVKIFSFVSCPNIPEIELINMNKEAVVTIIFGLSDLSKKRIGLKNIPPPIPTTPDTKPIAEPIKKDKYYLIELNLVTFFS